MRRRHVRESDYKFLRWLNKADTRSSIWTILGVASLAVINYVYFVMLGIYKDKNAYWIISFLIVVSLVQQFVGMWKSYRRT